MTTEQEGGGRGLPEWLVLREDEFLDRYALSGRPRPQSLARVLTRSLRQVVTSVPGPDQLREKPLVLELGLPLPSQLRFYLYLATQHESERQADAYRIQLTSGEKLPSGKLSFQRDDGIRPIVAGYVPRLDLFILWDADAHDANGGFPMSKGVQAPPEVVYGALVHGTFEATRAVRSANRQEVIVAARSDCLVEALARRIELSNRAMFEVERAS